MGITDINLLAFQIDNLVKNKDYFYLKDDSVYNITTSYTTRLNITPTAEDWLIVGGINTKARGSASNYANDARLFAGTTEYGVDRKNGYFSNQFEDVHTFLTAKTFNGTESMLLQIRDNNNRLDSTRARLFALRLNGFSQYGFSRSGGDVAGNGAFQTLTSFALNPGSGIDTVILQGQYTTGIGGSLETEIRVAGNRQLADANLNFQHWPDSPGESAVHGVKYSGNGNETYSLASKVDVGITHKANATLVAFNNIYEPTIGKYSIYRPLGNELHSHLGITTLNQKKIVQITEVEEDINTHDELEIRFDDPTYYKDLS